MIRPHGKLRTRLVLIFVVLVGAPLLLTGVLLSLAGSKQVERTGRSLNALSRQSYGEISRQVTGTVTESLQRTGKQLGQIGHRQLAELGEEQNQQTTETLRRAGLGLMKTGDQLLRQSNQEMIAASSEVVRRSGSNLRAMHQETIDKVSKALILQSKNEFAKTGKELAQKTKDAIEDLTKDLNEQRARGTAEFVELFFANEVKTAMEAARVGVEKATDEAETQNAVRDMKIGFLFVLNASLFSNDGFVLAPHSSEVNARDVTRWRPLVEETVRERQARTSSLFSLRGGMAVTMTLPITMSETNELRHVLVADIGLQRIQNNVVGLVAATKGTVSIFGSSGLIIAHSDPRLRGTEVAGDERQILNEIEKLEQNQTVGRNARTFQFGAEDDRQLCAYAMTAKPFVWTVLVRQPMKTVLETTTRIQDEMVKRADAAAEQMGREATRLATQAVDEVKPLQETIAGEAAQSVRKANQRVLDSGVKRLNQEQTRVTNEAVQKTLEAATRVGKDASEKMDSEANRAMAAATRLVIDKTRETVDAGLRQMRTRTTLQAREAAGDMVRQSLLLMAVFLVLAVFGAVATASSIVRPILQLAEGASAIAQGDYAKRVPVHTGDEIGELANSFNAMAQAVEQSRDVLAFQKSRLQAIVESSPDGLITEDEQGRCAILNAATLALLQLPTTTPLNQPVHEGNLAAEGLARLAQCRATAPGDTARDFVVSGPRSHILQVRAVPVLDEQGRTHGRLITLHDVTQEREIDQMKTDFVSMVSHELRTPLTSILGFSSYLLTGRLGELNEEQRTALESMHRQSTRLKAIISDFLDISRIESGIIEMSREHVQLAEVARRVFAELAPTWQEKGLHVGVDDASAPQALAVGDEARLAQVFTNLVGNAIKFTEPGGSITIRVSLRQRELIVEVHDTGVGIPEEELPKVFDRFYQVEKVVTRKTGGTGLGLAIVKNIVEAHGGRISVESRLGRGTTFRFTVPAAAKHVQTPARLVAVA